MYELKQQLEIEIAKKIDTKNTEAYVGHSFFKTDSSLLVRARNFVNVCLSRYNNISGKESTTLQHVIFIS